MKPMPPVPEIPQVIVVTHVTPPQAPEIIIESDAAVIQTWMSEDEAKAEARKRGECVCDKGDPLCDCTEVPSDNGAKE